MSKLIASDGRRAYEAAAGNSLRSFLTVYVDEFDSFGKPFTHNDTYRPSTGRFTVIPLPPEAGDTVPSPDEAWLVTSITEPSHPAFGRIWVFPISGGAGVRLTPEPYDQPFDDDEHIWSPDGVEIIFVRFFLASPATAALMKVPASGGTPEVLVDDSDVAVSPAYSPDGRFVAFRSTPGIEVMEIATGNRTVIVPRDAFPRETFTFISVGMAWLRTEDTIVFPVFNRTTNQHELWAVTSGGNNLRRIAALDMLLSSLTAVRTGP